MKALTLTQPYATLVAEGWKKIETRSWRTHYRGPLALHAAAGYTGVGGRFEFERICLDLPKVVRNVIDDHYGFGPARIWNLPLGALIAVTYVLDCVPTEESDADADERAVGDFSSGRWAWELREPVKLNRPIPIVGHQGLWDVYDSVIPESARRAIEHAV